MYESWFRFRRRPFAAAPRVDDYYPAESSELSRKSLISCVQRGAGPGLLIGSAGSGKSTLCHQLLNHFRTRTAVALVSCSGLATRRAMFQSILFELGRPYRDLDEGELRLSLVDYLTSRDASQSGTVLLFDDAHHLNVELFEDLRMLSSIVRDGHWCVHLVLSGNVRLEEILSIPNLESLNQRIAARCYLEPFRSDETAAYVRRQFERVEGDVDTVFIAGALTAIHESSGGTPRLVNQLCDHALLLAATGSRSQLDEHGIREAWSDLQHLPPPEKEADLRPATDEVVEFGSLDHETPADLATEMAVTDRAEGAETDGDSQHPSCQEEPRARPPYESSTAEACDASSPSSEMEDDSDTQFDDTTSFDLEPIEADGFGGKPKDAVEFDAETSLSVIEAHLDRFDDDVRLPTTENPFLENFAEEEVIVDRPSSLLNRVVNCQPCVTSRYGQELQTALDHFSIATAKGQPRQLASDNESRQVLTSAAEGVFPDETISEETDFAPRDMGEAVSNDSSLEYAVDFSIPEVAVPEANVREFPAPDVNSNGIVVERILVAENAAIEVAVPDDVARGSAEIEKVSVDATGEEVTADGAICAEDALGGGDYGDAVDASSIAFETRVYGGPYQLDIGSPIAENGEVIEVFDFKSSEHQPDTCYDSVTRCDTERLSERESESQSNEIHQTSEARRAKREPLPRDAKPGRRLSRLFSDLADR